MLYLNSPMFNLLAYGLTYIGIAISLEWCLVLIMHILWGKYRKQRVKHNKQVKKTRTKASLKPVKIVKSRRQRRNKCIFQPTHKYSCIGME